MADHVMHKGNRNAFMPILAATLTTVGALSMIFLLEESIRLNLQDFAAIVMINLCVSLFVAALFVPSLIERIHLTKRPRKKSRFFKNLSSPRLIVKFTRGYEKMIRFLNRKNGLFIRVLYCYLDYRYFCCPIK